MEAEVKLVKSLYQKGALLHFSVALLMLTMVFDLGLWVFVALCAGVVSFFRVLKDPIYKIPDGERHIITSKYKLPWYSWVLNFSGGIVGGGFVHFVLGWDWLSSLNLALIILMLTSGIMTLVYITRMQTD